MYCLFCFIYLIDILYCVLYCILVGIKKKSSSEGKFFIFRVGKGFVIRGVSLYLVLFIFIFSVCSYDDYLLLIMFYDKGW